MNQIFVIDKAVNSALETIRTPLTNKVFWVIGLSVYLAVLATLVYFFFIKPNIGKSKSLECVITGIRYPPTWILLASYAIIYLVLSVIKQYASRLRPDASDMLSFPSRHAAFAFFIAITFPAKKKVKIALYAWAIIVAFSRVAMAEHWLSDVVFGAGFGLLAGVGFNFLVKNKNKYAVEH